MSGADINAINNLGRTPLMIVISSYYIKSRTVLKTIVNILIENGADISIKDTLNETAFSIAEEMNYKDIIEMLKKN